MMRQMRENTKWIMLATALSFVALMVFQWGMDVTGRSSGGRGEIGSVNGTPVMYEDYMASYRSLADRVAQGQEDPITSQQQKQIEDAAFNDVVTRILMSQELKRRGIRVTDDEIREAARYNPPPDFQNQPVFQTDGQFDLQKYQQFISSPQADESLLRYLEDYYRTIIPRGKLMRQITSGLYFTDEELWQDWRDAHETVQIQYLAMDPGQRVSNDQVDVSDAEMQAYYDDHQDDFSVPARAQVKAVVLRKAPTPADTAASWEHAREVLGSLEQGGDFAEVAKDESTDQLTAEQGGELGVIPKGQMLPALDSAVFATAAGGFAGPVQTPSGLHVLQVEERWGQDSVRARHVVLPIQRTDDSEMALLTLADSLESLAEAQSLEDAAADLGLEVQDGEVTDQFAFLSGAGQVGDGADWALNEAAPGDVSPVFENSQSFYALELVSSTPGGILPFATARAEILGILRMRKKVARAETEAQSMVERIRAGTGMADVAGEAGLEVREAGPFTRNDLVPGIGRQNAAIGAAFGLRPGEVSDPVTADQNVFIIEQTARTPADSAQWEQQKSAQRNQLMAQTQQQRVSQWIEGLRAAADIVDRREQVLQPAEEQPLPQQRTGLR